MSTKPQIELFLENESGTQQVAYPFVESDHVSLSNGMDIDTMIRQDVSMPTVAHEDLSFKVGVGDQDVSSAIVDSSVAEMTIKGKTYQNILPEPSTHVLTNNKEMFKVNEGLDPNAEIVDGVSKSAILSGNTLVNLVKKATINVESNQNDLWININKLYGGNLPKGKYILLYNIKKASSSTFRCTPRINLSDGTALYEGYENYNTTSGIKKWIFNATAEITDVYFWINTNTEPILVEDFILLEYQQGMENWDIPYFTGMQSVKVPVLSTTGKNLLDVESVFKVDGNTVKEAKDGSVVLYKPSHNSFILETIKVKANTTYTISCEIEKIINGGRAVYGLGGVTENKTAMSDSSGNLALFMRAGDQNSEGEYKFYNIQLEEGSTATSYEPHKSNILTVNEPVELRGIGDVKDTLDCLTGEVTQRIGEYTIDGNENWAKYDIQTVEGYNSFVATIPELNNLYEGKKSFISGDFKMESWHGYYGRTKEEMVWNHDPNKIGIKLKNETVSNVAELKAYLASNPITFQYELATPVIKTVDLSSSGNWEKIVLDGSEDESWGDGDNGLSKTHRFYVRIPNLLSGNHSPIIDSTYFTPIQSGTSSQDSPCVQVASNNIYFRIERQIADDLTSFKAWLQQNPLTVWYPTTAHQDSTQVKQPIFFKDGHIQLSSGADNSLIPTLDYQAKTSNSYVMDLMKTNTKYTMKAKSASGTFTIDGTSYGAGTNGTFTTPSSMTNKLLVMSNKTNEEVMILEGDVTDKTIPYFKGIKSAFEDEGKIEVLSTGKNLFDGAFEKGIIDVNGNLGYTPTAIRTVNYISVKPNASYHINLLNLEPFESARVVYVHEYDENFKVLGETQVDNRNIYTSKSATKFIKINTHNANDLPVDSKMIVCENSTLDKQYEPYKTNSTKIPLLSPLRSLPDGTCDELIIDRMKKKATLIQRVGVDIYNGSETWGCYHESSSKTVEGYHHTVQNLGGGANNTNLLSNSFRANYRSIHNRDEEGVGSQQDATYSNIRICISRTRLLPLGYTVGQNEVAYFQKWLQSNPVTVLYPLLTPVVTEVDLEGFPYIYKDGHIFLNGEITPVTEIKYSINQQHQIEANNQDIIRHQKEIDYLYKLIGEYVRVDYKNTLLSLNLELK